MSASLAILGRLLRQVKPLSGWMLLAICAGLATIICGIGLMTLSAYLISVAAQHPSLSALAVTMLGVRIFGVVRGVVRYIERLISHDLTFRLLARFRVWFYRALEPLVPARLLSTEGSLSTTNYTSGDLLSRLVADVEMLQEFYVRVISPPVIALIIGAGMYFILGAYNVRFALVLLAFMLLGGLIIPMALYWMSRKLGQRLIMARAALNTSLVDSIQGVADLLIFDRQHEQLQRTLQLNRQLIRYQALQAAIDGLREGLDIMLSDGCAWAMLIVAIPLVRTGQLNGIYLALIILAALSSFEAIRPLANAAQQLGNSLAAARRLFMVVDEPPPVRDPEAPAPTLDHYDIQVRHLSFRYQAQEADVIKDLDFQVEQGHCLAIVGPSGAGKSTLANLLVRFWEYERGSIRLGGHELHEFQQQDIHRYIGVVEQHPHLFNGTIRENLLLGCPDATQEQIEHAARQAMLHDFIQELPDGYETRIGEQGVKLSGGERQRLTIARVILKDAPVLILDEATAHLDTVSEQSILEALRTFMRGRTTIIITHRLVGLEYADEILVMRAGRIIERGLHHELLQIEGLYWHLWTQQQQVLQTERW
ncbi:thiol reductant ABC exporter subunit CydC [Dictyobacter aurantiacus]|uniref:Thiol reductant ABC exporter subunit CydC n=1 Tax=Dictyobacter aurantiacus TaxID=1936993 RepID=A0A401Z969_9CHLR|nr:thiol reductant ABC exporter subunit CydC [Dictyobacter aurantiacus]GCE03395.1 thiol reductant ABC exporter subunit CydC [Dictyobacter aurantiacus]